MKDTEIDNYLKMFINQPLLDIGREEWNVWFCLGEFLGAKDIQSGNTMQRSTLTLHLQCPFRIVDKKEKTILFASNDIYEPNSATEWTKDFDCDIQVCRLFDEKSKNWLRENTPIHVADARITTFGDLRLIFSNDNILDVFVDTSTKEECWRFFKPYSDKDHFVVNGKGVVFEYEID